MITINSKLVGVQAPGRRSVDEIIQDMNTSGPTEGQVRELLDDFEFVISRLAHADSERFN